MRVGGVVLKWLRDGRFFQRLAALASELGIFLAAGFSQALGDRRHNTAAFFGPDGSLVLTESVPGE